MKVHTKIVIDADGRVLEEEFYEYDGPVALCGGSGSSGRPQVSTTTTSTEPPSFQKPYLERGLTEAEAEFEKDRPTYFPGSTITEYAPETERALRLTKSEALSPGSLVNLAGGETAATLRGDYLQPENPVYQSMLRGVSNLVRPEVSSRYALAGRGGSPGHTEAYGRGVTAGMMPYIDAERARQQAATLQAPQVAAYAPSLLAKVGGAREAKEQQILADKIARHDFAENLPGQKLDEYLRRVSGGMGTSGITQTSVPTYKNPLMTGLGAAATGAGILGSAFGGPGGGGFMRGK